MKKKSFKKQNIKCEPWETSPKNGMHSSGTHATI